MNRSKSWDLKTAFAILWMLFTVALAVWLFVFYARLFLSIEALGTPEALAILKHHRMVVYEMGTMIVALIVGGIALLRLIWLERQRSDQIRGFFAVFSHELKTSLSRLRLQAEGLQDELNRGGSRGPALRLLDDMGKLEVQLDNSLWVARADEDLFLVETIPLSQLLSEFAPQFPLLVHLSGEAFLRADRRAVESILKNILQNAVVHGEAQNLWIEVSLSPSRADQLRLVFRDDGRGFQGDKKSLGQLFLRHARTSGSGLGLYLVQRLSRLLGGEAHFRPTTQGFQVEIDLPGQISRPAEKTARSEEAT